MHVHTPTLLLATLQSALKQLAVGTGEAKEAGAGAGRSTSVCRVRFTCVRKGCAFTCVCNWCPSSPQQQCGPVTHAKPALTCFLLYMHLPTGMGMRTP